MTLFWIAAYVAAGCASAWLAWWADPRCEPGGDEIVCDIYAMILFWPFLLAVGLLACLVAVVAVGIVAAFKGRAEP